MRARVKKRLAKRRGRRTFKAYARLVWVEAVLARSRRVALEGMRTWWTERINRATPRRWIVVDDVMRGGRR